MLSAAVLPRRHGFERGLEIQNEFGRNWNTFSVCAGDNRMPQGGQIIICTAGLVKSVRLNFATIS
ncbi:unnamed protein product [Ectocarpus sp. CCAP 1310/34]|nr:unnamed protein product [Ectocarpus sp. CCAP 1310/34]